MKTKLIQFCPKCGQTYWNNSATSSENPKVQICPTCQIRETYIANGMATVENVDEKIKPSLEYERRLRLERSIETMNQQRRHKEK